MASSNHTPGLFSICPKHKGFYKSCGCPVPGAKKVKAEKESTVEEIPQPNAALDV